MLVVLVLPERERRQVNNGLCWDSKLLRRYLLRGEKPLLTSAAPSRFSV
jgi:hypothetical protein